MMIRGTAMPGLNNNGKDRGVSLATKKRMVEVLICRK